MWGDGEQAVNLVYVGDVADMLVQRAIAPESNPLWQHQAGITALLTVNEVADYVIECVGGEGVVEYVGDRSGEQNFFDYPEPDARYTYAFKPAMLRATVESYKP